MRIINFLWNFSTGGIGKCFLTYDRLGEVEPRLAVKSVCVIADKCQCDESELHRQGITILRVRGVWDVAWMKPFRKICDDFRPDAFFCHAFNGPIMLRLFNLRYGRRTPLINSCHGVHESKSLYEALYNGWWMRLMRSRKIVRVICVGNYTRSHLARLGVESGKVRTVYNGIEAHTATHPLPDMPPAEVGLRLVTASRLVALKGGDYMLRACRLLKERGVPFRYFCIGDGEEEEHLRALTAELGLDGGEVTFVGYRSDIASWLAACDVFVLPSFEENHSIAILEAMRAGCAIVATAVGGTPESLREGEDALLVPPRDAVALANALQRMATEPDLRRRTAESAHRRFEEMFTIDKMMQNLAHEILSTPL